MQEANTRFSAAGAASTQARLLGLGVALCFIGHGAFGIVTKKAWLPYFAVAGIGEPVAWHLMPWIGAMDVTVGIVALLWPCRALFVWAAAWTTWTALLRPFSGEGWSEFFERAGNFGVPLAVLAVVGLGTPWFARLPEAGTVFTATTRNRLSWALRLTTATLLAGHAGCGVLLHKVSLARQYAYFWPNDSTQLVPWVGAFEFALAFLVLARPAPALLFAICGWKLATESLFFFGGTPTPVFELIERGGSYVAPLALAILLLKNPRRTEAASELRTAMGA